MLGLLWGLMFLPFLYTQSRASYLAFIPTILVFLLLHRKRLVLVTAMITGLIIGSALLPDVVMKRVLYTFQPEAGQAQARIGRFAFDPSTSQRLLSSQAALEAWTEKPIFGYGVTGFRFLDAQYPRTLVETGVFGFLAFGWLLFSVARLAWQSHERSREPSLKGLTLGYLAGFAGLLVHGIGANTFIIVRVMEPFWFFTAIIVLLPQFEEALQAERDPEVFHPLRR